MGDTSDDWIAEELPRNLAGQILNVYKIKEYVMTETPCYLFKTALKSLEVGKPKRVVAVKEPPGRRQGTYPDDQLDGIELRFERSLF
jgi:hypothetical protein